MIELTPRQMKALLPLFERDTHIIARSCCQGLVRCRAFADDAKKPTATVVVMRRFGIAFAAGDARHAAGLLDMLRGWHPWYEIADPPDAWQPALAAWSRESHATVRYAMTNDPGAFDLSILRVLGNAPDGCEIRAYDSGLVRQALAAGWSEDQLGGFQSATTFLRDGLGIAVVRDGKLVAGCTSFCRHADGYEIQIDTHPDMRGRGYATAAGAVFILEALMRGQTPYWDAANASSLRLAQKLGYVFDRAYPAWVLIAPKTDPKAVDEKVIGT